MRDHVGARTGVRARLGPSSNKKVGQVDRFWKNNVRGRKQQLLVKITTKSMIY